MERPLCFGLSDVPASTDYFRPKVQVVFLSLQTWQEEQPLLAMALVLMPPETSGQAFFLCV